MHTSACHVLLQADTFVVRAKLSGSPGDMFTLKMQAGRNDDSIGLSSDALQLELRAPVFRLIVNDGTRQVHCHMLSTLHQLTVRLEDSGGHPVCGDDHEVRCMRVENVLSSVGLRCPSLCTATCVCVCVQVALTSPQVACKSMQVF